MSAYILGVLSAGDSDQQDLAFSIEPEKNNQTKVFHFSPPKKPKNKTKQQNKTLKNQNPLCSMY